MSVATINQKEYLKKYLSGGTSDKKKKKRKKSVQPGRVQIVDDDIDLNNMQPLDDGDYNLYELAEDAPQIAGIVDERPEEVKALELFRGSKWKIIQDEHGIEDIKVTEERKVSNRDDTSDRFHDIDIMPPVFTSKSQGENSGNVQKNAKSPIVSEKVHDDSDTSPPRRCRATSVSDESPPRNKRPSNIDASKKSERYSSRKDEATLLKRGSRSTRIRNRSVSDDSDVSPPRKASSKSIYNDLVRKKSRNTSDSDMSPPRARKDKGDPTGSPSRKYNFKSNYREVSSKKSNKDLDSDESPPRRARNKENSMSPQRKPKTFRKKSRFEAISDESPPRKYPNKSDYDGHQQRSRYQHNSDRPSRQDQKRLQSSERNVFQRSRSDSDESPPRRKGSHNVSVDKERVHAIISKRESNVVKDGNSKLEKQERTLEGKKAGLQDAKALRQENLEHQLREKEVFAKMSDEVSGKNAVTVLRDRVTGKKRDLAREAAASAAEKEEEDKKKEKYYRWGKGLKQVENQESRLHEDLYEMSKPLARYADDKDLEKYLMEQEREGDPMQEYIRSQKLKKEKENPSGADEVKKYPVYQGPQPPPNRFGIKPGYRWDGVDRSTGFEQKWFQEQNSRKALQDESYKWSTEDM